MTFNVAAIELSTCFPSLFLHQCFSNTICSKQTDLLKVRSTKEPAKRVALNPIPICLCSPPPRRLSLLHAESKQRINRLGLSFVSGQKAVVSPVRVSSFIYLYVFPQHSAATWSLKCLLNDNVKEKSVPMNEFSPILQLH